MLDIGFYMKVFELKQQILSGVEFNRQDIVKQFESFQSEEPVVYNIETTNACNMRCRMCPRTTMMTRGIETMSIELFKKIAGQLKPHGESSWRDWEGFVEKKYGIRPDDMSENHFFLYVIPKVLVLHGYGDPLLDKNMPQMVGWLAKRGIPSYFSCNPANIQVDRDLEIFKNGLNYIKYSIESVDDIQHKDIRGKFSDFTSSYKKILHLMELKEKFGYATTIVITMLNLKPAQQKEEFDKLRDCFRGRDVYIYLKSQDQQWYQKKQKGTQSIHWLEFCQFPWSSMTIKSNGEAVMCVEDFNNEIILGDARSESLKAIWNGEKYRRFRQEHFDLAPGIKCTEQCDMRLVGHFVKS